MGPSSQAPATNRSAPFSPRWAEKIATVSVSLLSSRFTLKAPERRMRSWALALRLTQTNSMGGSAQTEFHAVAANPERWPSSAEQTIATAPGTIRICETKLARWLSASTRGGIEAPEIVIALSKSDKLSDNPTGNGGIRKW
ncbi:hypothetical protein NOVOSPHI9U_60082 [Novosphingobium sp. 9U]|nr:hypothetical protein NOVOSPHI9U_60082 [Novosphingobium sp. 9U]